MVQRPLPAARLLPPTSPSCGSGRTSVRASALHRPGLVRQAGGGLHARRTSHVAPNVLIGLWARSRDVFFWARRTVRAGRCALDWLRSSTWGCGPTSRSSPRTAKCASCCPAAARRAGRLRRRAGAALAEGLAAAARPGGRLRARAHGQPAQRRDDLPLPALAAGGRAGAGRRCGRPWERFPRRTHPDTCLVISHPHRMAIKDRENRRLAPEGALLVEHRAQGARGSWARAATMGEPRSSATPSRTPRVGEGVATSAELLSVI